MSEIAAGNGKDAAESAGSEARAARCLHVSFYVIAAAIVVLATALRFLSIAKYEIWLDETYAFAVSRKSIAAIFADLACDNGPPLHFIMLHYWMKVFGDSAVALRSMSAVFSVATVAVVLWWDTPWFSRRARLFAGFVLAITPLAIYYAQEARMYAPVAFFVLLSMVFLDRGLRIGGVANWAYFAVSTALSLYTSYAGLFVLPAGYVVVAAMYLASRDRAALRRNAISLIAAHAAAMALFAPWLPTFMKQPSTAAVRWISPMWDNEPHKVLIPVTSLSVVTTGGAYYPPYLRQLCVDPARIDYVQRTVREGTEKRGYVKAILAAGSRAPVAVMAMLAVFTIAMALRRGGDSFAVKAFIASCVLSAPVIAYLHVAVLVPLLVAAVVIGIALAAAFIVPLPRIDRGFSWRALLISWTLSAFMVPYFISFKTPLFVPGRYDLTACVGYAVVTGIALARMPRWWTAANLTVMGLLFLHTFGYMQSMPINAKYTAKSRALARTLTKGDVAIGTSYEYGQAYYHIGATRDDLVWIDFPRDNMRHFAWRNFDTWLHPGWEDLSSQPVQKLALWEEAKGTMDEALSRARPGGAIAIIWPGNPPPWEAAINTALAAAVRSMLDAGALVEDERATSPENGIWVLRKPGGAVI
jgi:4-amino-4-deoxy-L-arabinose transferase-like glycosyltransferase